MAIRGQPVKIKPAGLSDAIDGTNSFAGAMAVLQDLIPSPSTANQFVPRPASTQVTNFTGFTTPGAITALYVVGTRAYGMIGSASPAGHDRPFCYDLVAGAFVAIGNVTLANTPTTPSTTGDWTPPTMTMIANKIIVTHPGFTGVPNYIGWIDVRNFTSTGQTGNTHTSTLIDNLSTNVLQIGWEVGDLITGAGIQAGTYITAIASNGLSLTLSQATTATAAGVALTVSSGTTAAPLWGAGNVNGFGLTGVPVAVAQFNGRAWYAVSNGVQFSDALNPLQITNATQALTLGDNTAVNALVGVPLANQVVGGVIQSLIAFKGISGYYQITGDQATTNLASNFVNGSVGTIAPNTLAPTPQGIAYIAPDGLRFIGPSGQSSQPVGSNGKGVSVPFLNAISPTRMAAAYNQNVLRVSVQNGAVNGQPNQEYWFDMNQGIWTGPHSFPAALIQPTYGSTNAFLMAATGINAKLWQSTVVPNAASTYTENGNAMAFVFQPVLSPDNQLVSMNSVVWSLLGLALPANVALTIIASDEQSNTLDTISLSSSLTGGSIWGSFNWGAATWGSSSPFFQQYLMQWHQPLVFKQISYRISGPSMGGFVIGDLDFEYQKLGYPTP
jgi:hypothetical protein